MLLSHLFAQSGMSSARFPDFVTKACATFPTRDRSKEQFEIIHYKHHSQSLPRVRAEMLSGFDATALPHAPGI
jgi:hypothetical protein